MAEQKIGIYRDDRRKTGKPYLVRWTGDFDPHQNRQKRYCKSFSKRKDAEFFMKKKEEEFEAGSLRDEINITLGQLCEKYLHIYKTTYTTGTYRNYYDTCNRLLKYFHSATPIKTIRQHHAEEFISQLNYVRKEYEGKNVRISDSTRNIQLRNCKRIFNKAVEWKFVRENPFGKLKQVKAVRQTWHRFTIKEFKGILEHTPDLRWKAFYAVLYGCGLRTGEALNLLYEGKNIDFDTNQIHLFSRPGTKDLPQFLLKDKEARSITLPQWVKDLLLKLYEEREKSKSTSPYFFLDDQRWEYVKGKWDALRKEGKNWNWTNKKMANNLQREFMKACKKAGVPLSEKIMLHGLRKSWACNLAENGIPPKTLCELGGWSNPNTLHEYYSKVCDANREMARQVLDRIMGE